jgi:hypothetical protein
MLLSLHLQSQSLISTSPSKQFNYASSSTKPFHNTQNPSLVTLRKRKEVLDYNLPNSRSKPPFILTFLKRKYDNNDNSSDLTAKQSHTLPPDDNDNLYQLCPAISFPSSHTVSCTIPCLYFSVTLLVQLQMTMMINNTSVLLFAFPLLTPCTTYLIFSFLHKKLSIKLYSTSIWPPPTRECAKHATTLVYIIY